MKVIIKVDKLTGKHTFLKTERDYDNRAIFEVAVNNCLKINDRDDIPYYYQILDIDEKIIRRISNEIF